MYNNLSDQGPTRQLIGLWFFWLSDDRILYFWATIDAYRPITIRWPLHPDGLVLPPEFAS